MPGCRSWRDACGFRTQAGALYLRAPDGPDHPGTQALRRRLRDRGSDLRAEPRPLVVGQTAVPDKSNELTAIRQLLAALELKGRVVSIDALGCHTDIAEKIADAGGGYLLVVKANQSDLHEQGRCQRHLGRARSRPPLGPAGQCVRNCITHLPATTGAAAVADLVRGHWRGSSGYENSRHWVLDDTFQEDRCRLRTGHTARHRAALQRIALNLLKLLQPNFWLKMSIHRLHKMVARNSARLELRSWLCDDTVNIL